MPPEGWGRSRARRAGRRCAAAPGAPEPGVGQHRLPHPQPLPAPAVHPNGQWEGADPGPAPQSLHELQILHQGQRRHPAGGIVESPGQQQPLVAVGKLAPAAAQLHRQFHQAQGRVVAGDVQPEGPGAGLAGGHRRREGPGPPRRQAHVPVQQQQPGSGAVGHPDGQLAPTASAVVEHPGAGQGGQSRGAILAAPIHHQHLPHQLGRGGQIRQQAWQAPRLVAGGDHHAQGRPHRQGARSAGRSRSWRTASRAALRPAC